MFCTNHRWFVLGGETSTTTDRTNPTLGATTRSGSLFLVVVIVRVVVGAVFVVFVVLVFVRVEVGAVALVEVVVVVLL